MTGLDDARSFRTESRARWGTAASGWAEHADTIRRITMPVSAWLVDAIEPQPGHQVLELAAGTGETGFLAAELIQPGGTLVCTDFAPEMLSAAQRRAGELGLRNVRFKQVDAEAEIDWPAASLDAVLCRWGFMLMADPGAALRECRRVLKPGGRLALAAWTGPEDNRWSSLPSEIIVRRGLAERPAPGIPGQFAWSRDGLIAHHVEDAGFTDLAVDQVAFSYRFTDFDAYWGFLGATASFLRLSLAGRDAGTRAGVEAELRDAVAPFTAGDGTIEIPARTWVAAATA